jgi:predicted P-loop ATPase
MKSRGVWLQEIAELAGLTRAEVDELKEFMSQQVDRYRPPYGKSEEDFPRRFVFIGTVNPGGGAYLADLTGNRRFWPVACGQIDLEALARDRDQLWAEAAMMESRGDSIRLDSSLYEAAKAEQNARLADDPWVEILADYLDGQLAKSKTRFTSVKLLSEALDLPSEKQTQTTMRKLKGAMALIPNWKYKPTLRADGLRTAGYEYAPPTNWAELCQRFLALALTAL